jgi:serine/threonine protein kinase/WD40 repeat protein
VFTTGQHVGHYEILEKVGEGGMGIVYKARDTHLDRLIALKILRADKVGNQDQLRRFALEARAASTLNHPNIITVHDISSESGNDFIVMEFVRGKALDQLIPSRGMRLSEALKIVIQIADALAAAAAAGIVHRDLKPANVMVADSGLVKILDFGLAKLVGPFTSEETMTMAADGQQAGTREGTVVGTFSYMSPEQAEGKALDVRSDIFSFGALLYEMVTGQRAFRGDTGMSVISSILRDEPQPVRQLAPSVPRDLEKVINRCLRKDPERRFQNITDVRVALIELKEELESRKLLATEPPRKTRFWLWAAGTCLVAAFAVIAGIWFYLRSRSPQLEPRVMPLISYPGFQRDPAFSPDGNQIAFAWTGLSATVTHIYVKVIGTDTPLQLTSGELPDMHPAWAPDGKSIAFIRTLSPIKTGIYQIGPLGGQERYIAEVFAEPYQALGWSHDGKWLVTSGREAPGKRSGIFVISADTGQARSLSLGGTSDEFYPALSLDSRLLAFSRALSQGNWGIFVVPLDSSLRPTRPSRRLKAPFGLNRQPVWTTDGKEVVFANGGTVDTRLWRVSINRDTPARDLTITGEVAYQPAIAPQGARLAYSHDFNNVNIWSVTVTAAGKAGPPIQIMASPRSSWVRPNAFSPDARKIAFESNRSGPYGILTANMDGSNEIFLFGSSGSPTWSPDGHSIAFDSRKEEEERVAIYVVSANGGAARRLTSMQTDNVLPCWSHDGKWIYFDSNRTGRFEIFKISPDGGDEIQVTRNGGWGLQESPDSKFLFYTRSRAISTPLFKVPAVGGQEQQVLPSVHERWWAVGNQGVWFMETAATGLDPGFWDMENASTSRGHLRFLSLRSHSLSTPIILPKSPAGGIAISPNRDRLLFNLLDHQATEILLMENFR